MWSSAADATMYVMLIQWNLDIINLYITKSLLSSTIFFATVIVKCKEHKLDK